MLRLEALRCCSRRFFFWTSATRDKVLEQLQGCSGEDQVLDVVSRNKAKLSVGHVSCAVGLLWQFQKEKPQMLRTIDFIRTHPEFLTLRVLAENKISLMDDVMVVDMLYSVLRLNVEPHDSLVQQLVTEAWNRMDRFQMSTLSKFSICLSDQYLQHSTLMGQITERLSQELVSIEDVRVLTTLMISVSSLVSARLRDALVEKAEALLDSLDTSQYNSPRRVVQFLRNIKHGHRPLLEKCNQILLLSVPQLSAENISIIMGLYQSLQFNNCDFRLAARQRLTELADSSTDPVSFTKLFAALGPMAGRETREGLESTALLLADELNGQQALAVAETLEEIQCRNLPLINRIASIVYRNLDTYRPVEVARATQALIQLRYQSPELYARLRNILLRYLQTSVFPYEVTMLTRVLSMLPSHRLDEAVLSRIDAVLPQCPLNDLNTLAQAVAKWLRHDPSYHHNTPSHYVRLLQKLSQCGHERLRKTDRLELLLEELKYLSGEWFEEVLLEESVLSCQRLEGQITWTSVPEMALFLTRTNYLSTSILDQIAAVTVDNIDKIHYSATYATMLPFAVMNYDPPLVEDFFDVCIQRFTPFINSFDPHLLVLLGYALAVANCFPEEIIREIFKVDFLAKLDSQLETLPDALNIRIRLRLMELNRAVCLECPEFQVPWFHERYCRQHHRWGNGTITPIQQQIHKMLGEVLGGINCAKVAVLTPYFYGLDFECILDHQHKPIPYSEPRQLLISEDGKVQWSSGSSERENADLPPGAQRVALEFLDSKSFCKNSHHFKGEVMMKKRHLEILGYHVVQIPHFEWNSMELATPDAWKQYLRKKIFKDLPQPILNRS
ncbi:FAST kinase domain-containing protein 1, mitochondrial-like [Denticeps clupeoides]|uniref:RAP domain-containing protein n=1 Tax=Denticeps clupeoides TaxID=299321 RepID=A0AAY4CFT4_9TELE|nr:FAST kinase domain-containing protein 1, mitochondrial-like [Denticeps clupeoides]XP_028821143.1 FAST kinase domain-containing protein 1, mitochondrial-like [Denticeps clupeoides]XP_028847615.1 FAST kinase domain-containing protein 1, mitochondrial-like [Denticeps clupeoides]XP_028847616.1 FAST kinase domain-containing protein 1, mitochondrial-like [Denticeps clupeoides]